ncbi:MAG TPA: hypothetical protein VIB79_06940 [Candidatus Binatia bacterium]|jgi:hypothetical protein
MQAELLFRGIGYTVLGLLSVSLLLLSLISGAREHRAEDRFRGLVYFTLGMIGLCTAIALFGGYMIAPAITK